jgi:hypothetical protein
MTATVRNPKLDGARQQASDPAVDAVEFDGTSDVTLGTYSRGVFICADGNLKVTMIGLPGATGATVTLTGVKQGTVLPICISFIDGAGTTCSGVVLL